MKLKSILILLILVSFKYTTLLAQPTLTTPATGSTDNSNLEISFTLPEAASPGTVKMTFTQTGGTTDAGSPHVLVFKTAFESSGVHSTTLDGTNLASNTNVNSITGGSSLVDGAVYNIKVEYQDIALDPAVSTTNTGFAYDNSTSVPTLTLPAGNSTDNSALDISFSLPEAASSGTVKMTFTRTAGTTDASTHVLIFKAAFESSGSHSTTLDGTNLSSNANVNSVTGTNALVDGSIYDVKIEYQDVLGNSVASTTNSNFTYAIITLAPTLTTPANSSADNSSLDISFSLPESATAGTVKMIFTKTSGTDAGSPHTLTFKTAFESAGVHSTTLNGANLSSNTNVNSVTGGSALVDGVTYSVTLQYQNAAGNPIGSVTNTNFTYDNNTIIPTLTAPASSSTDNPSLDINFNLPEIALAGTVKMTFTKTSGTDAGSPHVLIFNSAFEGSGSHSTTLNGENLSSNANVSSITGGSALLNGVVYSVKIEYQDYLGNAVANATNTSFTYDNVTATPTLTAPANNSTDNSALNISFNLPETASSGTVKMTFTQTGGSVDASSPHVVIFKAAFESSGAHTTSLDGTDLTNNTNVNSVTGGTALVDGSIYSVMIEYQDVYGNTAATVTHTNFTYDNSTATPTLTTPASSTSDNSSVDISFNLPEAASSGTVKMTFTRTGGSTDASTHILTFKAAFESAGTHSTTLNGGNLSSNTNVNSVSGTNSLVDGAIYSVKIEYKDALGNPISDATNTNFTYDISTTSPTFTSPAASSTINMNVDVDFTLPENALSGTVKMNFHCTTLPSGYSGLYDRIVTFKPICEVAGNYTFTLNGGALGSNTTYVLSVDDGGGSEGPKLIDGAVYSVILEYQDALGNTKASVTHTSVSYETSPPTASFTSVTPNPRNTSISSINFSFDKLVGASQVGPEDITLNGTRLNTLSGVTTSPTSGNQQNFTISGLSSYTNVPATYTLVLVASGSGIKSGPNDFQTDASTTWVMETTPPTLTDVSIFSNNNYPDSVGVGGKVFVSFVASESLDKANIDVKINTTQTATITGSGTRWTASYTMLSSDAAGLVTFTINYKDLAGNSGTQVTTVTNNSKVTFSKTSPILSNVIIKSNNTDITKAKLGDKISISFTSSKILAETTIKLNDNSVTATSSNGKDWTATDYTLGAGDIEGILTITIDGKDNSGNSVHLLNNSIIYDKTAPSFTDVRIASNNANPAYAKSGDVVTLTFTASEAIKAPTVTINGNSILATTSGSNIWTATRTIDGTDAEVAVVFNIPIYDLAGNSATRATTTNGSSVVVDRSVPTISSTTIPAGNYVIGSVIVVTVQANGNTYSGQAFTVNGATSTSFANMGDNSYKVYYTIQAADVNRSSVGSLVVSIILKDVAGNQSAEVTSATVTGGTLTINTKPTYHITGTASRCASSPSVTVTITFTGIPPYNFTYTDGVTPVTKNNYATNSIDISANQGTYVITSLQDASTNFATIVPTEKAVVTENPLPSFSFKNATTSINKLAVPYNLIDNIASSDAGVAVFSGECVGTDGYFYPSLANVTTTPRDITVTYTLTNSNGCANSGTFIMKVIGDAAYFSGLSKAYCTTPAEPSHDVTVMGISGLVTSEHFSISGATKGIQWDSIAPEHIRIYPTQLIDGWHKVTFNYWQGPSNYIVIDSFNIVRVSTTIDFGVLSPKYCSDASQVLLAAKNYTPAGGIGKFFSNKSGLSTDLNSHVATFKPFEAAKNDTIKISYFYQTSTQDGSCKSDTITKKTIVYDVTPVDFTIKDNYNFQENAVTLSSTPANGKFYGYEIILNDSTTLKPSKATSFGNPISITCKYKDTHGCSSFKSYDTRVYKAVASIDNLNSTYCYKDSTFTISCNPSFGSPGEFWSYKGAINQTIKPGNTATYSLLSAGVGVDTVKYTYYNGITKYEIVKTVFIDDVGSITITDDLFPSYKYCISLTNTTLKANYTHPNGSGVFTYDGAPSALTQTDSRLAAFKPDKETSGDHNVKFTYTANISGCKAVANKTVTVLSLPVITFNPPANFNINSDPLELTATPTGGTLSAVSGLDNGYFKPAATGNYNITYSYTDGNGCSNSDTKTINVIQGIAAINGFASNNVVCYSAAPVSITGDPTGTGNGSLGGYFVGDGITNGALDQASFDPKVAGAGVHKITYKFKYKNDATIELDYSKLITVDSIPPIKISGLNSKYCSSDKEITPGGYPPSTPSTPGVFSGNGIVGSIFYPSQAQRGVNLITYTYTNNLTGCSLSRDTSVIVNSLPKADFDIKFKCSGLTSDSVEFVNNTTSLDPISMYIWTIEGIADTLYTSAPPAPYKFGSIGVKPISLYVRTDEGCDTLKSTTIIVGNLPDVNFRLSSECEIPGETVISATSSTDITHFKWNIDGNIFEGDGLSQKNYKFNGVGNHDVSLTVTTKGCLKTTEKTINILPYYKFADLPNKTYYQNFDSNPVDWVSRPISGSTSSWVSGTPAGDRIINSPASGTNSWYTNVDLTHQKVESSEVVSPCFDLSGLTKPMIKLSIWSAPEPGRDGAVLQYSLNGSDTWNNLGASNEGINWYSTGNIQSKPGSQYYGWSSDPVMSGWVTSRHNLDVLKGQTNVRFRIAYAADGNAVKAFNGFAFDNVWIGDREQKVLDEYFTNSIVSSTIASNNYIKLFEKSKKDDMVPIHYHTGSPSGDQLYDYYTAGPSSRIFYYGVNQAPYVFSNGSVSSSLINTASKAEYERLTDIETLKDPKITFEIFDVTHSAVNVKLKALKDLAGENLVLYCAIVKDSIQVGGVYYYNVLRNFIPNPGGTLLTTDGWLSGQSITQVLPVNIDNSAEYLNARVVIFVQNSSTNQVYQAASFKVSDITGIRPLDISNLVDVYPNPANNYLIIESENSIDKLMIFDVSGRVVGNYIPAQERFSIPVQNFENGIYIIKGTTKKGEFVRKFIKQ